MNEKFEKKIRYSITVLIFLMILPSFYLAYTLFQEKKFNQKVEQFVTNEFTNNGYTLIYKNISYKTNPKKIEFAFLSKKFTTNELEDLKKKLLQYDISNTEINIRQDTKDIKGEILNELGKQNKTLTDKDIIINNLNQELNEYKIDNTETLKELAILFPELKDVSIGRHIINSNTDSTKTMTVLLYQTDKPKQEIEIKKLDLWLKQKFKTDDIKIVPQQ